MIIYPSHALREYNPNHEPAGSSVGGRFARKRGGSQWHIDNGGLPESTNEPHWGDSGELPAKTAVEALARLTRLHEETLDIRLAANKRVHAAQQAVNEAWDRNIDSALRNVPPPTPDGHTPLPTVQKNQVEQAMEAAKAMQEAVEHRDQLMAGIINSARDIIRAENRGELGWEIPGTVKPRDRKTMLEAVSVIENLTDKSRLPSAIHFTSIDYQGRSNADGTDIEITEDAAVDTIVHEIGHAIETSHVPVLQAAVEFRNRRTLDKLPLADVLNGGPEGPVESLAKLKKGAGYSSLEVALKDEFADPYVGKVYPALRTKWVPNLYTDKYGFKHRATEVTSMGVQLMFADPMWFATAHPDHFATTFNSLRGL